MILCGHCVFFITFGTIKYKLYACVCRSFVFRKPKCHHRTNVKSSEVRMLLQKQHTHKTHMSKYTVNMQI